MPVLYSALNIQPPMLCQIGPQLCNLKQELQKIEAGLSEGYGFENSQTNYTRHHLGHPSIGFPGYFPAECDPQNSALNNDENNWPEAESYIPRYQLPATPPSPPEAGWEWPHEADVQTPHDLHEKQSWDPPEPSPCPQGATDDESNATSSGPSSPFIPGGYPFGVPLSPPQSPHEALYDSGNFGPYQSTPCSFSNPNWGTQQPDR